MLEGLCLIDCLMSMLTIYSLSIKCNLEFGCNSVFDLRLRKTTEIFNRSVAGLSGSINYV
jgi:hypothetical protein